MVIASAMCSNYS